MFQTNVLVWMQCLWDPFVSRSDSTSRVYPKLMSTEMRLSDAVWQSNSHIFIYVSKTTLKITTRMILTANVVILVQLIEQHVVNIQVVGSNLIDSVVYGSSNKNSPNWNFHWENFYLCHKDDIFSMWLMNMTGRTSQHGLQTNVTGWLGRQTNEYHRQHGSD